MAHGTTPVLVDYEISNPDTKRPIATYYFNHKHRLVKVTRSLHPNAAVQSCTTNMRLRYYDHLGATSAHVFDTTTGHLFAEVRRNKKTGKVEVEDFENPQEYWDPIRRTECKTWLALIPASELK